MKLLLDTHIWIWLISDPKQLSRRVVKELENPLNELWLSPVSIWEVQLLRRKKRIRVAEGLTTWLNRALSAAPFKEAPLTWDVARVLDEIEMPHGDPADGFLVASAKVFGLTLVTADEKLMKVRGIETLRNT